MSSASDLNPSALRVNPRPSPLRSLVASAKRITSLTLTNRTHTATAESWQDDAWDMYDLVGEQRFLASTLANRMSQARFFVGSLTADDTDDPDPVDDDTLVSVLRAVGHNAAGLAQMVQRLGVNLFVAGDGWLVGIPRDLMPHDGVEVAPGVQDGPEAITPFEGTDETGINLADLEWRMLSISEVSTNSQGKIELTLGESKAEKIEVTPEQVYLIRVWRPHPRKWWEADSPTRSSLPVLRELVGLTMHISAQVDSRLAGAGVFVVPQSAARAIRQQMGLAEDSEEDPFTEALIEAMVTPINDRANASAVVPLVVTVPDESADKFQHLTFSTPLDGETRELRDESIRRLALGQDAPPELLLGVGGMNHWGAWLVREDVVSTHIEPPLALICDALTTQYLWPVMRAMGYEEERLRQHVIWYNVDHMIMRPNRANDAMTLHDKGAISDEALRMATGFDETDAPEQQAEQDPAITAALDMVRQAPSLAQQPGLRQLVADIRAVLEGESDPAPVTPPDSPTGADPSDEPAEGDLPDTDENPAPQIAASGLDPLMLPDGMDTTSLLQEFR